MILHLLFSLSLTITVVIHVDMDVSNPLDERLWRERARLFRETGIEYRRGRSIDCDCDDHLQHTVLYSTTMPPAASAACRILFTQRAIADDDARRRFEQYTSLPPTQLHAVLAMDACAARDELPCLLTALGADVVRGGAANARYAAAVRAATGVVQRPYPLPSTANALERRVARALLRARNTTRYVFGGARLLQLIDERRPRVAFHFAPSGAWTRAPPAALAFVAPTNARGGDVCPFIKARYWCDSLRAAVGWQWRADADAVVARADADASADFSAVGARLPRNRRVLLLGTSRMRQLFETIACAHRRRLRSRRVLLSDGVARRDGACQCRLRDARPWRAADDADLCPSMHESALRGVRLLYAANDAATRALHRRRGNGTAACACDCTDNVARLVFDSGFELHYVFRGTIKSAPLPRDYNSWRGGVGPSLALDDVTASFDAIGSDYELRWLDAVDWRALHRFHFDAFPSSFACVNSSQTRARLSDMARRRTWRVPHARLLCARRDALVRSRFHRRQWPATRVDPHMCLPGPYNAIANIFLKMLL